MFRKKIKYKDYNGTLREGEFLFHLNQAEVIKWLTTSGDYTLDKVFQRLSEERNGKKIMEIFEDLLHRSYGRKSLDGIQFEKNEDIWMQFYQSEAYSILFCELVSDAKKAADFVNKIVPEDMAKRVAEIMKNNPEGIPAEVRDYISEDDDTEPSDDKVVAEVVPIDQKQ